MCYNQSVCKGYTAFISYLYRYFIKTSYVPLEWNTFIVFFSAVNANKHWTDPVGMSIGSICYELNSATLELYFTENFAKHLPSQTDFSFFLSVRVNDNLLSLFVDPVLKKQEIIIYIFIWKTDMLCISIPTFSTSHSFVFLRVYYFLHPSLTSTVRIKIVETEISSINFGMSILF